MCTSRHTWIPNPNPNPNPKPNPNPNPNPNPSPNPNWKAQSYLKTYLTTVCRNLGVESIVMADNLGPDTEKYQEISKEVTMV